MSGSLFSNVNNIQSMILEDQNNYYKVMLVLGDILKPPVKNNN